MVPQFCLHCKVSQMKPCEPVGNKSFYILGFPHPTVKAWLLRQSPFSRQLRQKREDAEDKSLTLSFKAPCENPNCKWGIIIETNDNRQLPLFPWVRKKSREDCFNLSGVLSRPPPGYLKIPSSINGVLMGEPLCMSEVCTCVCVCVCTEARVRLFVKIPKRLQ